jgi:hypothetical protein
MTFGETKVNIHLTAVICVSEGGNIRSYHTGTTYADLSLAQLSTAVCLRYLWQTLERITVFV